jgi:hypothetical protein
MKRFDFNSLWSEHTSADERRRLLHGLLMEACNISESHHKSHRYLVTISPLSHLKGAYQASSHHCLTILTSQVYHRYLCNISPLSHQGPTSI